MSNFYFLELIFPPVTNTTATAAIIFVINECLYFFGKKILEVSLQIAF